MAEVQVSNVTKSFGSFRALDDVSMVFPDGQFFGLLGPSGSGKTTLLRTIAGFIYADHGSIRIGGSPVDSIPVEKREIGMVFQNYALFPNMSIADNVGFGLRVRKVPSDALKRRVAGALDLVQLGHLGNRRPHELSGGQRQRVALARAVITNPRVLLLDEPLSALDKALRVDMQIELRRIQREVGITTIFVTHDQQEALALSDRVGILKDGRLVQEGTPREVYANPVDEFTARFLGEANVFHGEVEAEGLRLADGSLIHPGELPRDNKTGYALAVRPEHMTVSVVVPETSAAQNAIKVEMQQKIFAGASATCVLKWQDQVLKALSKDEALANLPDHGEVWLSWSRENTIAIPTK